MRNPLKRVVQRTIDRTLDYVRARQELSDKTSPAVKLGLRNLCMIYHSMVQRGVALPSVLDTGLRVFSEYDEDGLILFLLTVGGASSRTFVDIGSGNGIHASNCANLAFNLGFHGLFLDANERGIAQGRAVYSGHPDTRRYPPTFVSAFAKASTVNDLILEAGFHGEIDVLSIDIDGNDYWIWKAINCISPRIVVVETRVEYGLRDIVAPYDENYVWQRAAPGSPMGASPVAMTKLASELGYRLVGANRLGFNAVYLRHDVAPDLIPVIDDSAVLWHARNRPFVQPPQSSDVAFSQLT